MTFVQSGESELYLERRGRTERSSHPPVVVVAGYGMNSFIFGFHPSERSLLDALAHRGLAVYSFDFRGQGRSRPHEVADHTMAELGLDDLGAVIDHVRRAEKHERVHLVGCSLGTAIALAYVAHRGEDAIASFVALGGLVRWVDIHPALKLAFASPALMRRLRLKGARRLARGLLPLITRYYPRLLSIYVNTGSSDLSRVDEITQTVEDPHPPINEEIAHWIARRDLIVRGVNVSRAIEEMKMPTMVVVAKDDGVVPEACGLDVYERMGSRDKELLVLGGDPAMPIAHADLFLSRGAEERVFEPIARFLLAR
jgi:alpha-beta hydrolase superfamily lysophospholipase